MLFITFLGSFKAILALNLIIAFILIKSKKIKLFFIITLSSLSNFFIIDPLKFLFKEPRPINSQIIENSFSFPSGHAYSAVTFYGLVTYLLYKKYKTKSIPIIGTIFILLISYSRIYLNVHYFHDIVAGLLLGIIWLIITIKYENKKS